MLSGLPVALKSPVACGVSVLPRPSPPPPLSYARPPAGIFVLSGLALKRGKAASAVRSTGALAYGLAAVLLLTPLLAPLALQVRGGRAGGGRGR